MYRSSHLHGVWYCLPWVNHVTNQYTSMSTWIMLYPNWDLFLTSPVSQTLNVKAVCLAIAMKNGLPGQKQFPFT